MTELFDLRIPDSFKERLTGLRAHWVSENTILWNTSASPYYRYSLIYSPNGSFARQDGAWEGVEIPLEFVSEGSSEEIRRKFPHLAWYPALRLPALSRTQVSEVLKGALAVIVRDGDGWFVDLAGVQIPGVLDDLFAYSGELGVIFNGSNPGLHLWAPTARKVSLHLFKDANTPVSEKVSMQWDADSGVWHAGGKASWLNKFYLFEVEVYFPSTGRVETNLVTDPYSYSLSTNSKRSQIVNLRSSRLKPQGWSKLAKPLTAAPEDMVVYELHVRDFSVCDESVPVDWRGTYKAFTASGSRGMKHLHSLASAGITHIQLLPVFDFSTVNEDKSTWKSVDAALLATYPPDSELQMAAVEAIAEQDAYNWGYDPYHFITPEGGYSTNPDGFTRILEFREMIQSLAAIGLRVVMDVVFNHTFASGMDEKSVLCKVVPGYYYRLNGDGRVENSTCCSNTASEHAMMRKLMVDALITWAKEYRVDGFRFDLMGHHMLADMQAVRAALDSLTLEKDGVDGKRIFIYGEGWDFGEVANNARGMNATQRNIAGSGIGVFNDRIRDAVRGGSAFGDIHFQGFSTGLFFNSNEYERRNYDRQMWMIFDYADWIRLSLAGNLKEYEMIRCSGERVTGQNVWYNGSPAGFAEDPQENVVYISAHDNETLWDAIQLKASPVVSVADRVRMNNLALSIVAFCQGVPFFHAGDELLRSKSLNRNSYNSGDWFNKLDWTYNDNNWGIGLPGEGRENWHFFRPLLANPALRVTKLDICSAVSAFREFLQVRKSSPLFRLRNTEQVKRCVSFKNTGQGQIPGLIVMILTDADEIDPNYNAIFVLFNASPYQVTFGDQTFVNLKLELHPAQAASTDEILKRSDFDTSTGFFNIPGRTTAVFILRKPAKKKR